ncbi:MFS transporter [Micromonospora polyrhachis]|uniref:DHA2 family multidrug resistance protein-like MFS transporter n=1 Tax=Micromonospora polyrhachis TaxID=1282883 RepID=A0A7W7SQL5_9ACTN|nr:MFS transporter [Micromonospora polyrhachis]MBB4959153.1 DHA2 family multidrug resistance protein-like MFS transporter [Micromonospora polyrhachis]
MSGRATAPADARAWAGMALLALPTFLLGLDVTVLYLVLPAMAADLGPSATQTLWIMDAYGFLLAGFLVTMGTLGDRVGRRRLLMLGIAAFAAVSVVAAFALSAELLIAARALLGIAGATLMPSTLSLISNMFPDPQHRAVAIGVWATMFAAGMAAGPIVGGVLVDRFWWGAAFLVAVPIAAIVLLLGRVLLPEYADPRAGRLDLTSVTLSLAVILPIVYAIKHAAAEGFDVSAIIAVVVGVIAGAVFWHRQSRLADPLLDVSLFKNRAFSVALTVLLVGLVGMGGTMYLVTQYLQLVEGLSPFVAGLWMGPPALAMFAAGIGAPVLARRIRPGYVMGGTLGVSLIGYVMLATAGLDDELPVAAGFAFVYLGLGAIAALGTDIVVGAAPAAKSGSAASLSETVQELGIAIGVAILGSLTTAIYRTHLTVPAGLPEGEATALTDSLSSTVAIADDLPPGALVDAQLAFTTGLNVASVVAGLAIAAATMLCLRMLRHVPQLGRTQHIGSDV